MSFENLPKGSILYIEAKDPLAMAISGAPTFTYPIAGATPTTAGGQSYNTTVATRNILLPTDKDVLKFRRVSEHNRSEFNERTLKIEQNQRMANGLLRKYYIADKKQWDISWNMLPSYRNETVDGAWGAEDLKTFYESEAGTKLFRIKVNTSLPSSTIEASNVLSASKTYDVIFTSCDFTVVKRGLQPYWNVKLSMEQI